MLDLPFNEGQVMHALHSGIVGRGFQYASGDAVSRATNPSPFSDSTLALQRGIFVERNIDFDVLVPGWKLGTINVELGRKLLLEKPDYTAENVDWTVNEATRIAPETFHFVHCCLAYAGRYYPGLIYYPDPKTKPATNRHNFDALEIITTPVPDLAYGARASVLCRADAFSLL